MATVSIPGAMLLIYNEEFIQDWITSHQTSLYYSLQVMQNTQAKDDAMAALDENFEFDFTNMDDEHEEPTYNVFNDPTTCVGCAE